MENLNISDQPPPPQQQGGGGQQGQQGQQQGVLGGAAGGPPQSNQLPPQMFTTAAQLLDFTDKKIMVALRDGRKLIGVLRSWDQFANLVLQSTVERIFAHPLPATTDSENDGTPSQQKTGGLYADIKRGVFLVRGENVLLVGEIDLDRDDEPPAGYEQAEPDVVHQLADERRAMDKVKDKARLKKLSKIGFEGENMGEVLL